MTEPVDIEKLNALWMKIDQRPWSFAKGAGPDVQFKVAVHNAFPAIIAELEAGRAALKAAQERIAVLEEAAKPFLEWIVPGVELANKLQSDLMSFDDDCEVDFDDLHNDGFAFLWGDFRRLARALEGKG